ncbi:MAG: CCA tRNA nucleotidyltransferase, partial [Deltaproteobacteria bacterium]
MLRETAQEVVAVLENAGHRALFAGGCVRDRLLGREPADYDIATSATPDEVERLFSRAIGVGRAFGVMIVPKDGQNFEVATFRRDGGYDDGRHPRE